MEKKHEVSRIKTLSTTKIILLVAISFVLVFFSVLAAQAASLYFSPSSGTYSTGLNFTVNVKVSSSASLNAVSGAISFLTDKLEVIGVSKTSSIINLWAQEPSFSNSDGNIRFEGIVLNPGFSGDGKLLGVIFRAKSEGAAELSFASGSVLANDGLGTNILSDLGFANFSLTKGAVSVPESVGAVGLPPEPFIKHYIQDKEGNTIFSHDSGKPKEYINSSYNKLEWVLPTGINGVSLLLNDKPISNPGSKSDGFFDNKVYEKLDDGVYYLHIRFINALSAGPILHYKFTVDTVPPKPFKITFPAGLVISNPIPRVEFSTSDELSGLDHYEMKIDSGEWFGVEKLLLFENTYVLSKQKPGDHRITVRAFDKAGNYTDAEALFTISPIVSPTIDRYPSNITSPGEKLVLEGTSLPKAQVEINLNKKGQEPIIFNTFADQDGNWQAIYDNIIPSGTYEVWAKQILEDGAESLPSKSVVIGVNSWFWRAWQWVKNVGGIIIVLLILIAAVATAGYYFWRKFRMWRIKLRREVHEAESALKKGFKKLQREVKSGKTTKTVVKDLSAIEKDIEKEIKDIEKKP